MSKLAILSAALLVGGYSFANAQSTPGASGQTGAGTSQTQCWDAVTNQVREKSAATGSGSGAGGTTGSSSGESAATGSGTSGSTGSGSAATSGSGSAGGSASSRPAGMANC
jgi:hypothetical protein